MNADQTRVFEAVFRGHNVYIGGRAGCGKSFLISEIVSAARKAGKSVALTCTTGVACCCFSQGHVCGGSLIDDRHILTAAHCFQNMKDAEVVLKRNRLDQTTGILTYTVTENNVFIHQKYNKDVQPAYNYDIAMLRLPEGVVADIGVHPVCLWDPTYAEQDGDRKIIDMCIGDGGGPFVIRKGQTDTFIQTDNVRTFLHSMPNTHLSSLPVREMDLNTPLSGVNYTVRWSCTGGGIVSFGVRACRDKDTFGFYTKLTEDLLEWIKEKTKI